MSKLIKHIPCLSCGSSDARALYDDGHEWCFSCNGFTPSHEQEEQGGWQGNGQAVRMKEAMQGVIKSIPERGITRATCEKYNVHQEEGEASGKKHFYPYKNGVKTPLCGTEGILMQRQD